MLRHTRSDPPRPPRLEPDRNPLMSVDVFAVILLGAALHATWNAVVKGGGDTLLAGRWYCDWANTALPSRITRSITLNGFSVGWPSNPCSLHLHCQPRRRSSAPLPKDRCRHPQIPGGISNVTCNTSTAPCSTFAAKKRRYRVEHPSRYRPEIAMKSTSIMSSSNGRYHSGGIGK